MELDEPPGRRHAGVARQNNNQKEFLKMSTMEGLRKNLVKGDTRVEGKG